MKTCELWNTVENYGKIYRFHDSAVMLVKFSVGRGEIEGRDDKGSICPQILCILSELDGFPRARATGTSDHLDFPIDLVHDSFNYPPPLNS